MDEPLLSVRDIAREYGVAERTIRSWCQKGLIDYVLVGSCRMQRRMIRITRAEANKHFEEVKATHG